MVRVVRAVVLGVLGCVLGGCGLTGVGRCHREVAGIEAERVAFDGGELSVFEAGDARGQRVILVHGTPGDASAWSDYLKEPIEGVEMVAVDRPGFGCTTPRGVVTSIEAQAKALEPLLVGRDGKWPILVGHSLGGPIVTRAAIEYPDRVGGLVILAGALDPDLERVMWVQNLADTWVVSWLLPRGWRHANQEVLPLRAELEAMGAHLGEVRCPVVIVHGTRDRLVGYENVAYMKSRLTGAPRVDVVTLEGEDHFIVWTAEGAVREAIGRLLR